MAGRSGSLRRYLAIRLLLVIPNVFVLLTLVFLLLRVAPGDPVSAALGGRLPAAELARRRAAGGYDDPILVQYWHYLSRIFTGDFGTAVSDNRPITNILLVNGAATLSLTLSALVVACLIGIPLGLLAARYRDSLADVAIRVFGVFTYAAPVFFVGVVAIIIFTGKLGWLPSGQQASPIAQLTVEPVTHIFLLDALLAGDTKSFVDGLKHLVMPAVTLGLLITGVFIRLIRVNVAQTLRDDYVEAARARGIAERRVVFQHAFRNAMVPFVTVLGLQAALSLGGAILTETTFSWPGLGSQLVQYINARDYVAVQGIMTIFALVVVGISLLIDLINAFIDPRVRY
ncbi:peptide/nickel transport system permease protein [Actinopolymorpha cephalotaxi]|uniref:Peptide/nickel transport system permease protein n=1 Tax=Actinopolymorpha cephalotaxi TaxID=504797 RepID=A0A1I3BN14_9ACTN|nr:ABC transporter permease [Actinopolymorpha cephalotaxi]NYH82881.1 peptide/nickel transport system permease protein [Actinopolymorpha cephalotaxi]SFH63685.1 peptide/nickel transport system permease protein [Actinopolymorpha cephalotaxi]